MTEFNEEDISEYLAGADEDFEENVPREVLANKYYKEEVPRVKVNRDLIDDDPWNDSEYVEEQERMYKEMSDGQLFLESDAADSYIDSLGIW